MGDTSNVGGSSTYGNDDQRTYADKDIKEAERYKEGKENSHLPNDSKDERTIANKLGRESKRAENEDENKSFEDMQAKEDPTLPARSKGNKPSKGAIIDKEIQDEEEEILKKKGAFGPAKSN